MATASDLSARKERTVAELFRTRQRGHTCDRSDIDLDVRKLEQERRNVTPQQQPASIVVPHQPAVRRGLRAWLEQNGGLWARWIHRVKRAAFDISRGFYFLQDGWPFSLLAKAEKRMVAPRQPQHAGDLGNAERHMLWRVIVKAVIQIENQRRRHRHRR